MARIFENEDGELVEVVVAGKKEVGGTLIYKAVGHNTGKNDGILAVKSGRVIFAGRKVPPARASKYKVHVDVMCDDGSEIIYQKLSKRLVKEGDPIKVGDVIGENVDGIATLEFRRNGRLADGREELREWKSKPPDIRKRAEKVCRTCKIPDDLRRVIDARPDAKDIWNSIYLKIELEEDEQ